MTKRRAPLIPLALLASLAVAAPAGASDNATILNAALRPASPAAAGGPTLFGVPPGAAPWQIDHGRGHVKAHGRVVVRTTGLTIPGNTPPNPLPLLAAAVYCDGTFATRTDPVPFSTDGDAQIDQTVDLPSDCDNAAVLLNPVRIVNGVPTVLNAYIASAGV
jgi:hypothetical protein